MSAAAAVAERLQNIRAIACSPGLVDAASIRHDGPRLVDHHSKSTRSGYCAAWPISRWRRSSRLNSGTIDSSCSFCGEFGARRWVKTEGREKDTKLGRDHHRSRSASGCGGGFKGRLTYGKTDDIGWSVVENLDTSTTSRTSSINSASTTAASRCVQGPQRRLTDKEAKSFAICWRRVASAHHEF